MAFNMFRELCSHHHYLIHLSWTLQINGVITQRLFQGQSEAILSSLLQLPWFDQVDCCFQKSASRIVLHTQIDKSLQYIHTSWTPLGKFLNIANHSQTEGKLVLLRTKVTEINHFLKSLLFKVSLRKCGVCLGTILVSIILYSEVRDKKN